MNPYSAAAETVVARFPASTALGNPKQEIASSPIEFKGPLRQMFFVVPAAGWDGCCAERGEAVVVNGAKRGDII